MERGIYYPDWAISVLVVPFSAVILVNRARKDGLRQARESGAVALARTFVRSVRVGS